MPLSIVIYIEVLTISFVFLMDTINALFTTITDNYHQIKPVKILARRT